MTDKFTTKHHASPDYELEVHITGVRMGDTGKTHWQIGMDENMDNLRAAEILEKAAEVLRSLQTGVFQCT